jgi:anti-sigma B factor antagonist
LALTSWLVRTGKKIKIFFQILAGGTILAIALNNTETVTVLRLAGDIGNSEMGDLLGVMNEMVLQSKIQIVLNFSHVNHISLKAISALAGRKQRFQDLGGDIKIVGLIPYVANLFKLVGAFSFFEILSSEDEAVYRFES